MRYALLIVLLIHAVAHVAGFAVAWRFVDSPEMPYRTTIWQGRVDLGEVGIRIYGLCWLGLAMGWAIVAAGAVRRVSWWLPALEILVLCSMLFCALEWPEARLGVLANLFTLLVAFGAIRFTGAGLAVRDPDVERLWETVGSSNGRRFDAAVSSLPGPARRFLEHSIAGGTLLAGAAKLTMRGEIKLGRWLPFRAEQVITRNGEFVWAATVSLYGLPIRGSDRLLNGQGAMRWKLLDAFPVASASGPEVTRSALGRLHGEQAIWLPSCLLSGKAQWSAAAAGGLRIRMEHPAQPTDIGIEMDSSGRPTTVSFKRWGDPGGQGYREVEFGALLEQERTFGGYTIPTRIRAGWFFGGDRFQREGEFFRCEIVHAEYK